MRISQCIPQNNVRGIDCEIQEEFNGKLQVPLQVLSISKSPLLGELQRSSAHSRFTHSILLTMSAVHQKEDIYILIELLDGLIAWIQEEDSLFHPYPSSFTPRTTSCESARLSFPTSLRQFNMISHLPSDAKLLLMKNYSGIIAFEKLRISYVIP